MGNVLVRTCIVPLIYTEMCDLDLYFGYLRGKNFLFFVFFKPQLWIKNCYHCHWLYQMPVPLTVVKDSVKIFRWD